MDPSTTTSVARSDPDEGAVGEPSISEGLRPILSTSLADAIAFRVETAILDGVYPPGSRLPQDELCERFAVSRTPVREALRKLQAKGLVVVVPNKGATVRLLTRKELLDIYDVRAELEGYSCELAGARITDVEIGEMDQAQADLEAVVELVDGDAGSRADPATLLLQMKQANDRFHASIHRTAGNGVLFQVIKDMGDRFPKDYVSNALRWSPEVRVINVDEHRRIRAALGSGDGRAARKEMHGHILHARAVIVRYLDAHGFWT